MSVLKVGGLFKKKKRSGFPLYQLESGPGNLCGEKNREGVGERRNRDWETEKEGARVRGRKTQPPPVPGGVKLLKKKKKKVLVFCSK